MNSTNINSAILVTISQSKTSQEIQYIQDAQSYFDTIIDLNTKAIELSKGHLSTCIKLKPALIKLGNVGINIKLNNEDFIKFDIKKCTALQSIVDEMYAFNSMIEEFNNAVSAANNSVNSNISLAKHIDTLLEYEDNFNVMFNESGIASIIGLEW